jgi:hypothetical protein
MKPIIECFDLKMEKGSRFKRFEANAFLIVSLEKKNPRQLSLGSNIEFWTETRLEKGVLDRNASDHIKSLYILDSKIICLYSQV